MARLGATIIEKHFTLDKSLPGPDHKASLDVDELKEMVKAIRDIESAKGSGEKKPAESELSTREVARKSIVVNKDLRKGDILTLYDLEVKRPGTGIAPKNIDRLIGKKLNKDLLNDSAISCEEVDK